MRIFQRRKKLNVIPPSSLPDVFIKILYIFRELKNG